MGNKDLVRVGIITAAHGVRGQVKIKSLTSNPEDIFSCGALSDPDGTQLFQVDDHAGMAPNFIVTLKGINDRNAAESLKGVPLFVRADTLPKQDQLHHTLIGMEARLADGKTYGRVTGIYNFGAGDIIDIELANGKSEMLPLNEKFVEVKKNHVIIFPPDYVELQ